jgi:hypothetical protein
MTQIFKISGRSELSSFAGECVGNEDKVSMGVTDGAFGNALQEETMSRAGTINKNRVGFFKVTSAF